MCSSLTKQTVIVSRPCRDVFLRELISNANDALEKLRLTSLTEPQAISGAEQMNVTIKAIKDEDGTGRLIITGTYV